MKLYLIVYPEDPENHTPSRSKKGVPPGTCRRLIKFPLSLRMGYFALVKYSSHLPLQIKVVACSDRQPLFVIHIADLSLTPSCVEILVLQSLFIRICHANWPTLRYGKVTCNLLSYLLGKTSGNAPAYQRGRVIKTGSLTSAYELAGTPAKNSYHDLLKKKTSRYLGCVFWEKILIGLIGFLKLNQNLLL